MAVPAVTVSILGILFLQGVYAIQWSSSTPPDMLAIYACTQDTITIPWEYILGTGDSVGDITWLYDGHSQEIIAIFTHGMFLPTPAFSHRVLQVGNAGLTVQRVLVGDSGNYTVEIQVFQQPNTHDVLKRTVFLRVHDRLMTTDGSLHAFQGQEAVLDPSTGQFAIQLLCGAFTFNENLPFYVEWVLRKACAIPREVNTACPDLSIQRNDTQNNETATNPSNFTSKFNTKNCSLLELTRDCRLFREIHGYNDKPVEEEEKGFPLAFSIKMHSEPEQAEQLLRVIYRPHNVYCIHVDAKAPEVAFKVMVAVARCLDNVHMAPGRVHYVYKSYDVIRAELRNMACALQSTIDWRYYLNVAGQEMPLRTNLEMVRVLQLLNGTNDIESFPIPGENRKHFTNIYNISKNGKYVMTNKKKEPPPFEAEIRKGTQYGAFSREFVTSLFYDETVRKVMDFFKDTFDPDEKIWATVNQLPWIPGGYPVHVRHSPSNQHISKAVAWKKSDPYRCKGSYVRSVCIFTIDDLPWLLQQPNFFANKFYPKPQSLAAAECLEAVIGQRARSRDVLLDQSYYENLPHVKYRRDVIVVKNSSAVISKEKVEKVEVRKNNKKM